MPITKISGGILGQDGQTLSLTQGFQDSAESPDLLRTTQLAKEQERHALFMGMGDGLALENAGLISRNNSSDRLKIETERKERDKKAYERALELMSKRLSAIQAEMFDLEEKIADSRVIIAGNQNDIDFIRSLDTDNLISTNGVLREDVNALLKKHGYHDLNGKSEEDIRHMLTAIEVQAIEQNDREQDKIDDWLGRHADLRRDAQDIVKGQNSDSHQSWVDGLANRDPELLARNRLQAVAIEDTNTQAEATEALVEVKLDLGTNEFSF